MEDTKAWWASRTIWASIAQVLVGIAVSIGVFDATQGAEITAQFPDLIVGVVTAALGLITFWGRFVASKLIK